jgi:CubicO group peptidase (beta-lactamase class C family)
MAQWSTLVVLILVAFVQPAANPDSTADKLDTYLKQETAAGFSGSVLVACGGKVVLDKDYGRAANVGPRPAFWLASISKPVTATAVLKLQDQKKLSIDDPITRFFPVVPADKRRISVRHLLTHTSGLGQYSADGIADRDQAVRAILAQPLKHTVGEKRTYSGDGFVLLAALIEVASGKSFEDYLQAEIFKPAEMKQAGCWGQGQDARVAPVADVKAAEGMKSTVFHRGKSVANWGWRGGTGLSGTSQDLYHFLVALRDSTILSDKSRTQMWSGQVLIRRGSAADTYNGYGWTVDIKDGRWREVRHLGNESELGHNGIISMQETGDVVVVLSNAGDVGDEAWSRRVYVGLRGVLKR